MTSFLADSGNDFIYSDWNSVESVPYRILMKIDDFFEKSTHNNYGIVMIYWF